MKKCFTINPLRTVDEVKSYYELFEKDIYQAIEIFFPYNQTKERYDEYTNSIKDLINSFVNIEVVMHLPFGPKANLCDLNNFREIMQVMKDGMDYSNLFNIKKLTLHLGIVDKGIDRSIYLEHIHNVLVDLCDYASKYEMIIMIENMPGFGELGYSPDEILNIIKKVNKDNLKFILDTGHANVSSYNIADYVYTLKNYLYHLHLSDNNGARDEHARLGLGNINFYDFLNLMKEINYQELYCLEILYNAVEDLYYNALSLSNYDK